MMKGLQAHGLIVFGDLRHYDEEELLEFCARYQPDFIFEMNRPRKEIPFLPKEIMHIDWVVDTNGRPINYFQESEITYLFAANWLESYRSKQKLFSDWLGPGVDPEAYYPEEKLHSSDFSFVGHMPRPWSKTETERRVGGANDHVVTFGELNVHLQKDLKSLSQINYHNDFYIDLAISLMTAKYQSFTADHWNEVLRYDIGCRSIREFNRRKLIDLVLSKYDDLRLFGPENWQHWPRYGMHYRGFLSSPEQMREVYQSTKINLHEGVGLHFRVLDCLASRGLLFALSNPYDKEYGGIETCLEPGNHYIPFTEEDFYEKANYYLVHEKDRQRLAENAASFVKKEHSWFRRWQKVLADIERL